MTTEQPAATGVQVRARLRRDSRAAVLRAVVLRLAETEPRQAPRHAMTGIRIPGTDVRVPARLKLDFCAAAPRRVHAPRYSATACFSVPYNASVVVELAG